GRLLAIAAEAEPHLWGSTDAAWMDRLEKEHEALRSAFSWFLDHGRGADALELAADLWLFQEERGHAEEARAWLAKALAAPGAEARSVTRAKAFYRQNLALHRELGRMDTVSVELGNLGAVAVLEGNLSEAEPLIRESLEIAYKRGDRYLAPYELIWLGRVALGQGNPTRAATLFAAAKAQFDATGLAMDPDEGPEYEKALAAIRGSLDDAPFAAAWAEGHRMSLDDAVPFALGRP